MRPVARRLRSLELSFVEQPRLGCVRETAIELRAVGRERGAVAELLLDARGEPQAVGPRSGELQMARDQAAGFVRVAFLEVDVGQYVERLRLIRRHGACLAHEFLGPWF